MPTYALANLNVYCPHFSFLVSKSCPELTILEFIIFLFANILIIHEIFHIYKGAPLSSGSTDGKSTCELVSFHAYRIFQDAPSLRRS